MESISRSRASDELGRWVTLAQGGDRAALERVVRAVQPDVHGLAVRFLWHPQDAEDATQEILIRVVTRLSTYRAESSFRTWVYRIATNALLTIKKSRAERQAMSFDAFAADLGQGLSDALYEPPPEVDRTVLLEEIKVGCTLAMLLCLDRAHRIAFILGEIMELGHRDASGILGIQPAAFRKRLSRARRDITDLMRARCGLFDARNRCRCRRRVGTAIQLGRVDPRKQLFASTADQLRQFPEVLREIRALEEASRSAALYRTNQTPVVRKDFARIVRRLLA